MREWTWFSVPHGVLDVLVTWLLTGALYLPEGPGGV